MIAVVVELASGGKTSGLHGGGKITPLAPAPTPRPTVAGSVRGTPIDKNAKESLLATLEIYFLMRPKKSTTLSQALIFTG